MGKARTAAMSDSKRSPMARSKKRRGTSRPQQICKICASASGPWTREDAYPVWLRRRVYEWYRALPPGRVESGWKPGSRTMLAPVCQRCQRRLNALFEMPARPLLLEMLTGSTIDLSSRQQVVIAGWFVKTAIVLGLARNPNRGPTALPELSAERLRLDLCRMLKDGTPPIDATTRLAYVTHAPQQTLWPPLVAPT